MVRKIFGNIKCIMYFLIAVIIIVGIFITFITNSMKHKEYTDEELVLMAAITTEPETKSTSSDTEEQNKSYGEILWNVYYLGQIEGKEFTFPNAEGNSYGGFAVYDIDGDDSEELLLYFDGGAMATTVEYIWGYANGSTHVELSGFPLMTYYDNGIIEVG